MFLNNDPMRYITGAVLLSLSSGVLAGTKGRTCQASEYLIRDKR